ncbi:hypothetical protein L7F22_057784 [Adiantum nelumboides]|nr:hypothetical protein [Adiantum nelumboides]
MGPDTGSESEFPAGLRVLVVDDDRICLLILDRLLRQCLYRVTTCERAVDALKLLRDNKDGFDVVISEAHMPDMDGYKLLELIGLEMGLPVLMMSSNGETNAAMKGIKLGACDYLVKPVRIQELKNIWKHAIRPKRRDPATLKKPQVGWSVDLHQKFVNAVNSLGIEKAVPKRILEDVASHLQKYRLYPKYTKLDNVLVEDIDVKPLATRTMPLFDQGCRERELNKKHLMADHLSRITNGLAPTGIDDDLSDTSLFMVETIPEWSEKIVNFLINGFPPKELRKDVARKLIKECEPYSLIARTLYKLGKDDTLRQCAREDEHLYILQEAHMGIAGGHFSGELTARKVLQSCYW